MSDETNLVLTNRPPAEYLAEIRARYPGALQKQFIPEEPMLWSLDRYQDFLERRRQLVSEAFNKLMSELFAEMQPAKDQSLAAFIAVGESATVEFKSSLRFDLRAGTVNKDLEKVVVKTIAGFLNTEGGVLLIGVGDDRTMLGIENDLGTLVHQNRDGFERQVACGR